MTICPPFLSVLHRDAIGQNTEMAHKNHTTDGRQGDKKKCAPETEGKYIQNTQKSPDVHHRIAMTITNIDKDCKAARLWTDLGDAITVS